MEVNLRSLLTSKGECRQSGSVRVARNFVVNLHAWRKSFLIVVVGGGGQKRKNVLRYISKRIYGKK